MAADRIKERDKDILLGDYKRLNNAAERWQAIKTKMGWKWGPNQDIKSDGKKPPRLMPAVLGQYF